MRELPAKSPCTDTTKQPCRLKGQRGLFFYRLFVVVLLRLLVSVVPLFIGVFFLGKGLS